MNAVAVIRAMAIGSCRRKSLLLVGTAKKTKNDDLWVPLLFSCGCAKIVVVVMLLLRVIERNGTDYGKIMDQRLIRGLKPSPHIHQYPGTHGLMRGFWWLGSFGLCALQQRQVVV
jgi:hypothetical protein